MKRNYNNPYGAFVSMTGENYPNSSFANVAGATTTPPPTCCCCGGFFCSDFAGNLGTSLGTIGAAYFGSQAKKPATANAGGNQNVNGVPPEAPTKSNTIYWVVGTLLVVGIAGTVAFAMHKKSA